MISFAGGTASGNASSGSSRPFAVRVPVRSEVLETSCHNLNDLGVAQRIDHHMRLLHLAGEQPQQLGKVACDIV